MMKKQTAVDYLVDQLIPKALTAEQYYHIEQAKEMEKQQMCKFAHKCHNHYKVYGDFKIDQYYNETFNSEK